MNTGRIPEAQEEFLKELSVDPEYANALLNLAAIDYQRGRRDEAAALWRRAVRAAPDNIAAYANLAVYHLSRGEYAQAREQCDQIRRRGGAVPQAVLDALARHIVASGK